MMYGKPNATEPSLSYWSERTEVPIYNREGDLMGKVLVTFSCANVQGYEYEVTDVVYGDLLNVKPEHQEIVTAIQEKVGLGNSLVFAGSFLHDPNLI